MGDFYTTINSLAMDIEIVLGLCNQIARGNVAKGIVVVLLRCWMSPAVSLLLRFASISLSNRRDISGPLSVARGGGGHTRSPLTARTLARPLSQFGYQSPG